MPAAFRVADPEGRFTAVRLSSDVSGEAFTRDGDDWVLALELPDVLRLEYKLEVDHADGGSDWILDPGNPKRTPGAFGEKSVLELPGYVAPAWLEAETRRRAASTSVSVRGRGLGARRRDARLEPRRRRARPPLRLLLANDGPEYDALSSLTRFSAAKIAAGELPPHRVALLAPGERNQWYSASAAYARVLAHDIVPALREAFGVIGAPVGDGREPRRRWRCCTRSAASRARSAALFLQSGQLLHAALRLARARLQPLRADRALRARDAARRAVRDPGAR